MRQSAEFLAGEGDAWFSRNKSHLSEVATDPAADPVIIWLRQQKCRSAATLEIGCSNGWRLTALRDLVGGRACGVEPSAAAVADGLRRDPTLDLRRGTADRIPFDDHQFDLIVFGFCLYLCDRADLFQIAAEADRVLKPGGSIVIYDFDPAGPEVTPYRHLPGLSSYRLDYVKMFDWHPAYQAIGGFVCPHPGDTSWEEGARVVVMEIQKMGASG